MAALKHRGVDSSACSDGVRSHKALRQAMDDVSFRYIEYCITAPLLFLAVLCLLTVDAPAWLFFVGYWMIQACTATGIAFHYSVCFELWYTQCETQQDADQGEGATSKPSEGAAEGSRFGRLMSSFVKWFKGLIIDGGWPDKWVHNLSLLNNTWLCLLVPIGGIVYMCRSWLLSFSADMPWLAIVMIWQLLITYCMFGIIPTIIYLSGRCDWIQKLPWWLDVLNLAAKWPLPIFIIIAFSTRPAGFHMCSG